MDFYRAEVQRFGDFVGDTPYGEFRARYLNSQPEWLENRRAQVDTCRDNYEELTPFLVNGRGVPPQSIPVEIHPSPSQCPHTRQYRPHQPIIVRCSDDSSVARQTRSSKCHQQFSGYQSLGSQ
ncbi:hypothetical protein WISP_17078 [Willisornis vidua]|uniref:MHC class II beta chain N-terminal domain-containing protein n=1 Tax=Willisornis vidua TaxID=1566151 RepID=A0ABQ9DVW2_9PASS|nr:hypothetical protein WISP_17078 [Willisornis vidua]